MRTIRNQPVTTLAEWNKKGRRIIKGSKADGFNECPEALFCIDKTAISSHGTTSGYETSSHPTSDPYQAIIDKRATDYYDWVATL